MINRDSSPSASLLILLLGRIGMFAGSVFLFNLPPKALSPSISLLSPHPQNSAAVRACHPVHVASVVQSITIAVLQPRAPLTCKASPHCHSRNPQQNTWETRRVFKICRFLNSNGSRQMRVSEDS